MPAGADARRPTPTATPTRPRPPRRPRPPDADAGPDGHPERGPRRRLELQRDQRLARDAGALGNHGTISGATRVTTGKFGGALQFDGVNDFVIVADNASLDLTKGMTIEAWVNPARPDRAPDDRLQGEPRRRPSGLLALRLRGQLEAVGRGRHRVDATAPRRRPRRSRPTPGPTSRRPTTARRCASSATASRSASKALAGSLTTTNDPLKFGGNAVWSEWFDGRLDEIRVWKVARTAAQIQTDMSTPIS